MVTWARSASVLVFIGAATLAGVGGWDWRSNVSAAQVQQRVGEPVPEPPQAPPTVDNLSASFRQVQQKVAPSVVSITSTATVTRPASELPFDRDFFRRFFGEPGEDGSPAPQVPGEQYERTGLGSGAIVEVNGRTAYIVTNYHVVAGATDLNVVLNDGRIIDKVQVVGSDPATDLAIVTLEADNLAAVPWGNSEVVQPGDFVLAFGSPLGYVGSMTHGIVSALHRQIGILGPYGYENFIQIDASINPGNSGGPLVNLRGEVIGINTVIASQTGGFQGIGFAIPSSQAQRVYHILREQGRVVRGWLGLQIADVSALPEEARAAGYKGDAGVLVKGVLRDSPAARQLEPGDVIVSINGQKVQKADELRNQIASIKPGNEVKMQVFRNGKMQDVAVKVGEQPERRPMLASDAPAEPEADTARNLGLRIADVSREMARTLDVPLEAGAVVTAIASRSLAAEAGIRPGDVITRINGTPIRNAADARQALAKADLKQGVRVFITNREGSQVVFLQRESE